MRSILLFIFLSIVFTSYGSNDEDNYREIIKREKIKSSQSVYHRYREGKLDTAFIYVTSKTLYDKNGRVVKRSNSPMRIGEDKGKFLMTTHYTYYDNGKMKERTNYNVRGEIRDKALYKYEGNKVEVTVCNWDETLNMRSICYKDDKGRNISGTIYDGEGNVISKFFSVYDEIGLQEDVSYDKDSVVTKRKIRVNNEKNRREYLLYDAVELRAKIIEVYEGNNLVEEITQSADDIYMYNTYEVTSDYLNSIQYLDNRRKISYSDNGLVKESSRYGANGELEYISITEYERWE